MDGSPISFADSRTDRELAEHRVSLQRMRDDLDRQMAEIDKDLLNRAGNRIHEARDITKRKHATVGWVDNGYDIRVSLTRTESFDEQALVAAVQAIDDPAFADRLEISYGVPDNLYLSLSPAHRALIDAARRVSYGVDQVKVTKG